ncbi:ABC transporter permease [Lichenicola cladoniae]|uniref:ABC transporter permease n=1 Tax=Lichenicola cladoniae TaxID=1484109 RepID=A0A6M8HLJ0_9PROT|nr:ABC transporter permease [Lichenicola cladoniae]NPD66034.1 ABC transporter permease [Acetobacteraceae bacterium]QKE89217.1 ABC transporter permease [Lichenicola cladoniae]
MSAGGAAPAWRNTVRTFLGRGLLVRVCSVVIVVFVVVTLLAGVLAPYNPAAQNLTKALAPASLAHPLGQDDLGRDVLSRIIYGGRVSLSVSILAGSLAAVVGIALGLISGYFGGSARRLIMGLTDVLLSIPSLVFSLILVAALGGGLLNLVLAIGIGMVPTYIRMTNGLALSLRENDYVVASRLVGQSERLILLRHLLPNCFPTLTVLYTINLGNAVLTESTLSYLGVGISPPTASWGSMVSDFYPYLISAPALVVGPSLCIILIIVSFNVVGDGLRDALDPRLRGRL